MRRRRVVGRSHLCPSIRTLCHFRKLLARCDPVELGIHDQGPIPQQVSQTAGNTLSHPDLLKIECVAQTICDNRQNVGRDVTPSLGKCRLCRLCIDHLLNRIVHERLGDHFPEPAGIKRIRHNRWIFIERLSRLPGSACRARPRGTLQCRSWSASALAGSSPAASDASPACCLLSAS
jgi:hypothetical protein